MSSIQIAGLVYFTVIAIGAWIFFGVIFLQLKRFMDMSCYVPLVSKILTIVLIVLTVLGYVILLSPSGSGLFLGSSTSKTSTSGYFDTY